MNMTPYMFMYNTTIKSLCLTLSWRMARSKKSPCGRRKEFHLSLQKTSTWQNSSYDSMLTTS